LGGGGKGAVKQHDTNQINLHPLNLGCIWYYKSQKVFILLSRKCPSKSIFKNY